MSFSPAAQPPGADSDGRPGLRLLFHRLNNQLGVILAHAELLEARAPDDGTRARAAQVVESVLEVMNTAHEIRRRSDTAVLDTQKSS